MDDTPEHPFLRGARGQPHVPTIDDQDGRIDRTPPEEQQKALARAEGQKVRRSLLDRVLKRG